MYNTNDRQDRTTHIHYLADGAMSLERKAFWDARILYKFEQYVEEKLEAIKMWREKVAYKRNLSHLNDRLLEDIGLTRADVQMESNRWFWRD